MRLLSLEAYWQLIQFERYLARGDFAGIYEKVRSCRAGSNRMSRYTVERVCSAVDMASIWYWKEVLCLQRSAATACILKRYGIVAEMVVGAQQMPFKAHAWVEVNGRVVNDKPYTSEMYVVLDRC